MAGTDIRDRPSDAARTAALDDLAILDTEPEVGFDGIVLLAGEVCGTPVALASLVAGDRQWFKARVGFPACETPLGRSVCPLSLRQGETVAIPDLALDERTKASPLVAGTRSSASTRAPPSARAMASRSGCCASSTPSPAPRA